MRLEEPLIIHRVVVIKNSIFLLSFFCNFFHPQLGEPPSRVACRPLAGVFVFFFLHSHRMELWKVAGIGEQVGASASRGRRIRGSMGMARPRGGDDAVTGWDRRSA